MGGHMDNQEQNAYPNTPQKKIQDADIAIHDQINGLILINIPTNK